VRIRHGGGKTDSMVSSIHRTKEKKQPNDRDECRNREIGSTQYPFGTGRMEKKTTGTKMGWGGKGL